MATKPRYQRWNKSGKLADTVHRAADLHAQANPGIKQPTPKTEVELASMMAEIADDLQYEMSRRIRQEMARSATVSQRDLQELRDDLADIANDWQQVAWEPNMRRALQNAYATGKAATLFSLADQGVEGIDQDALATLPFSFSKVDRFAMAAIANDNFRDIAGQTKQMVKTSVEILRTEVGKIIEHELAMGTNPKEVARKLEQQLVARGFEPSEQLKKYQEARANHRNPFNGARPRRQLDTSGKIVQYQNEYGSLKFVDRAGREWDLRKYCRMAAHTKLMIAHQEGSANSMKDAGVTHYQVSDHGTETEVCEQFEGNVYWLGVGDALGYDQASTLPPYHPGCKHVIIPRVDIGG